MHTSIPATKLVTPITFGLTSLITAVLAGILLCLAPVQAQTYDNNGFHLWVTRSDSLSDLIFHWRCKGRYDAFNVRVRISDGREGQVEVPGTQGSYRERNAEVGRAYIFNVQGCNKGTFSSDCTGWSSIPFKNTR
jgi:hypothetical protein